ncbi:MAG: hypothetical protein ABI399_13140 [Bauldia sp.]
MRTVFVVLIAGLLAFALPIPGDDHDQAFAKPFKCGFAPASPGCQNRPAGAAPVSPKALITSLRIENGDINQKEINYVDLKVACDDGSVAAFAQTFVEKAWNFGFIKQDREFALTLLVENVGVTTDAKPEQIANYLVARVKKGAGGRAVASACEDVIASNLPASERLRLKFSLLQSKDAAVSDTLYSTFRLASRVVGFFAGGAVGTAVSTISTQLDSSKDEIGKLVDLFDKTDTESPQFILGPGQTARVFVVGNAELRLERAVKRSAFLLFAGDGEVQNAGGNLFSEIRGGTGVDLDAYIKANASAWSTMLQSTDAKTAGEGCTMIRSALDRIFSDEERAVIIAKLIGSFGDTTLKSLKEPCLQAIERELLAQLGVSDPLPKAPPPAPDTPGPVALPSGPAPPDPSVDVRWAAVREFLDQFGTTLVAVAPQAGGANVSAKSLELFLAERVATQSFDSSDLLPGSDGAPRESLAEKIGTWPFGAKIRYGCFVRPSASLTDKYAGQMLVELNSGAAPRLVNVIFGFSDKAATSVDRLLVSHMIVEKAGSASLEAARANYPDGCGSRTDRWKPWEKVVAAAPGGSPG